MLAANSATMLKLLAGLFLSERALAQITGADCAYADGSLCIPNFCPAPEVIKLGLPAEDYIFTSKAGNGSTVSVFFRPEFGGYELDKICPDTVRLAGASLASNATTSTYYFPVGCGDVAPFPTYFAGTEDCDTSDPNCNPGMGILIGSSMGLVPLWIILIILLFYALALVCEEFLVPGINIVCEKTGLPDDVAGATLLAAGCNSPELFSSVIGIFIADSTVGVGTVLGSAPFNVCCITGGAALAVGGALHLDPWLMGRELIALFITLLMFLVIMDDYLVTWWEALLMCLFYCFAYVPVLAKFDAIKARLLQCVLGSSRPQDAFEDLDPQLLQLDMRTGESFSLSAAGKQPIGEVPAGLAIGASASTPALSAPATRAGRDRAESVGLTSGVETRGGARGVVAQSLMKSIANSQQVRFVVPQRDPARDAPLAAAEEGAAAPPVSLTPREIAMSPTVAALDAEVGGHSEHETWARLVEESKRRCEGFSVTERGSMQPGQLVSGVELGALPLKGGAAAADADEPRMKGTLYKKSRFYSRVRLAKSMWQVRYFVLDDHPTHPFRYSRFGKSAKGRAQVGEPVTEKFVTVPLQLVFELQRISQLELRLLTPEQTYVLRGHADGVEGAKVMQRWFDCLIVKLDEVRKTAPPTAKLHGEEVEHEHAPWYAMPSGALNVVFHLFTLPIKAMIFPTVPDVNGEQWSIFSLCLEKERMRSLYPVTITLAMVWLAILATIMTDVIEYLGCAIGVGTTVMGLSLGAIGTSFPNLYASLLVAKAGQGGMAICQAIASNTFNVCICLGLLWFIHSLGLGSCDYGTHAGGILGPCAGCYAPSGFEPLCPFFQQTNNAYGSEAGSTKGAVLLVFVWYALFIVTIVVGKNVVTKVPALLMFALYAVYLIYEFGAAFDAIPAMCISSLNICI